MQAKRHHLGMLLDVLVCAGVVAVGLSCRPTKTEREREGGVVTQADSITVFFTGNELGALKPCGCSGGQLGGLDRRGAVLGEVAPANRVIVDTGRLVANDFEQDLIKYRIIVEAYRLLGYDVVYLAEPDVRIAGKLDLLSEMRSVFGLLGVSPAGDRALPARWTRRFVLAGTPVDVTIAAADPAVASADQISQLFSAEGDTEQVNILIAENCGEADVAGIGRDMPFVDCVICPSETEQPGVMSRPGERPLVFAVGRFGRYVCRLDIASASSGRRDSAGTAGFARGRLVFRFGTRRVTEDLRPDPSLVELYKNYQLLVKESGLLERHARFALQDGLEYVGSAACQPCHEYEHDKWSTKAHAHAYATLERVGSQFDPECVICHVVGMEYSSGYVSEQATPHLKDVGCEICHGPGSEHVQTLGQIEPGRPRTTCLQCHTPERSADYTGNEQLFFEKIVHWKEPKDAGNVN